MEQDGIHTWCQPLEAARRRWWPHPRYYTPPERYGAVGPPGGSGGEGAVLSTRHRGLWSGLRLRRSRRSRCLRRSRCRAQVRDQAEAQERIAAFDFE